jgi:hypothetical protein
VRTAWHPARILAGLAALILLVAVAAAPSAPAPDLGTWTVHEWGTFLVVQGSNGVTMGGMVDSEEQLPRFVAERALNNYSRAALYSKMETPVTYFYTDRPRDVQVKVDMPHGLLTHFFPNVRTFAPPLSDKNPTPSGSSLDWGTFQVFPDTRFVPAGQALPTKDAPHLFEVGAEGTWRFARDTDSALVKVKAHGRNYYEKFLFYRGLGTFTLPLEVHSSGANDQLHLGLHNTGADPLQGLFAIWVEKGTIRFGPLADLPGGATNDIELAPLLTNKVSLEEGVPRAKEMVAEALVKAGLYPKEAQAMVNTWEASYFHTEGLRILSVLPRSTVDEVIPIQIKPAPQQLVRVMVGRIEVLTPEMEQRIEKQLTDIASPDADVRAAAEAGLAQLGRFKEPVLRRIATVTKAPDVRSRAESLITQAAPKK